QRLSLCYCPEGVHGPHPRYTARRAHLAQAPIDAVDEQEVGDGVIAIGRPAFLCIDAELLNPGAPDADGAVLFGIVGIVGADTVKCGALHHPSRVVKVYRVPHAPLWQTPGGPAPAWHGCTL